MRRVFVAPYQDVKSVFARRTGIFVNRHRQLPLVIVANATMCPLFCKEWLFAGASGIALFSVVAYGESIADDAAFQTEREITGVT